MEKIHRPFSEGRFNKIREVYMPHMIIGLLDIDGHNFPNLALMKISAEGFDYDKKGNIEGSRCNVLLKFGYNKKTKSIFNIEICLKMKYSNI